MYMQNHGYILNKPTVQESKPILLLGTYTVRKLDLEDKDGSKNFHTLWNLGTQCVGMPYCPLWDTPHLPCLSGYSRPPGEEPHESTSPARTPNTHTLDIWGNTSDDLIVFSLSLLLYSHFFWCGWSLVKHHGRRVAAHLSGSRINFQLLFLFLSLEKWASPLQEQPGHWPPWIHVFWDRELPWRAKSSGGEQAQWSTQ